MRYSLRRHDSTRAFPGIVAALALAVLAMMSPAAAEDTAETKPAPPAAETADEPASLELAVA